MEPQAHAPLRIFLSYGHDSNEDLVRRIKADLERRGHDVWFDKSEIKTGHDWRRSITEGILDSHRVLSFLSKHSTRDPGVCLDEIGIALSAKGGNILTILVENEREVKPPASISHVQWLDMHDWKEQRDTGEPVWEQWYQAKLAEIVAVIESDESRRFAGEIKTLEEYLKPISSDARMGQLLKKPLVGRKWLVEALEQWRTAADRSSRLFWIMGAPGVGKSAFAADLAHYRGDKVIAVQFCEYDKPDHRDAARIVRTIAFQIATRLPDFRKRLLTLPEIGELDRKNSSELFDYLLAGPLRSAIDGGRERYLIVIDALDEAGGSGRNELVEMLAREFTRLPDWIGMVATSRPESNVIAPLQGVTPVALGTETESNRADIRVYLQRELVSLLNGRAGVDDLLDTILEKSEGLFVYVALFCGDVQKGHLSLDRPEQFPQGLGAMLYQNCLRQFPDEEPYERKIEPMLGLALAARAPMPVEIIQRILGWSEAELRKWLRTLGSLFPIATVAHRQVITMFHKSLPDWLTDSKNADSYFVDVQEGHRRTAHYAEQNWRSAPLETRAYLLQDLPFHLFESRQIEALAALLSDKEYIAALRDIKGIAELLTYCDGVLDRGALSQQEEAGLLQAMDSMVEERLSRAYHDCWRGQWPRGNPNNPLLADWRLVPIGDRLSNRRGASDQVAILMKHGLGVRPGGHDPPPEFVHQLESLAAAEHVAWVRRKIEEKWTYGPQRDNLGKIHPMMIPWSEMPAGAREQDRDLWRRLPRLLATCGYEICKIPLGPPLG